MAITDFITVSLVRESCITCGVVFALPAELSRQRQQDHKVFFCPNGHSMVYSGKSEAEQAREETAREKRWREQAEARAARMRDERDTIERRRRAEKAAKTRLRNKVAKGDCPQCGEHFTDLHHHMNEKHPDFAATN